jgi:hypothetical protein
VRFPCIDPFLDFEVGVNHHPHWVALISGKRLRIKWRRHASELLIFNACCKPVWPQDYKEIIKKSTWIIFSGRLRPNLHAIDGRPVFNPEKN